MIDYDVGARSADFRAPIRRARRTSHDSSALTFVAPGGTRPPVADSAKVS